MGSPVVKTKYVSSVISKRVAILGMECPCPRPNRADTLLKSLRSPNSDAIALFRSKSFAVLFEMVIRMLFMVPPGVRRG